MSTTSMVRGTDRATRSTTAFISSQRWHPGREYRVRAVTPASLQRPSGAALLRNRLWRVEAAYEISNPRNLMPLHVVAEAVEKLRPDQRIHEARPTALDGRSAGNHELERITSVGDSSHAQNRNLHRFVTFIDHSHRNRSDGRSAQPSQNVRDLRLPSPDVANHCAQPIDED